MSSSVVPVEAEERHDIYTHDEYAHDDYRSVGEDEDDFGEDGDYDEEGYEEICAEDEQDYRPGGLHPVHLDDRLGPDGRFRVFHKLGFGGHGTVWLCQDQIENRWRAVKILYAGMGGPEKCKELETAQQLLSRLGLEGAQGFQLLLEKHHIALPVDHFTIQGPNGTHLALVYPLLGPSVREVFRFCGPHPELIKDICFQLVEAMDFLHRNGRCHGDFKSENILFRLEDGVDQWPEEKMLEVLGKPQTEPLLLREPVEPGTALPDYLVGVTGFGYTSGRLLTSAAVTDFGVSFNANDPPRQTSIPRSFAAPEDMIAGIASPGFPSDVWTLMHTIMEVRLGSRFLVPEAGISFYEADEIANGAALYLWESTSILGPMPKNYRAVWKEKGGFFKNGHEDDESVPVVAHARTLEINRVEWAEKTGVVPGDSLKFRLMGEHYTRLDEPLWDAIAGQDYKATGLLPRLPYHSQQWMMQAHNSCKLDPVELEQFYDLCKSIYRWQPQERALIGEILNHPWFGDRNKRPNIEEINTNNEVDMHEVAAISSDEGSQPDRASISSAEDTQQEDDFTVSTIDGVNDAKATVPSVDEVTEDTPMLGNVDLEKGYGAVSSKEGVEKDQAGVSLSPLKAVLSSLP